MQLRVAAAHRRVGQEEYCQTTARRPLLTCSDPRRQTLRSSCKDVWMITEIVCPTLSNSERNSRRGMLPCDTFLQNMHAVLTMAQVPAQQGLLLPRMTSSTQAYNDFQTQEVTRYAQVHSHRLESNNCNACPPLQSQPRSRARRFQHRRTPSRAPPPAMRPAPLTLLQNQHAAQVKRPGSKGA